MSGKFEIWAIFPDGITAKIETHTIKRNAQNAIDAMENHIKNELALGCGFPHGVPEYKIIEEA